MWQRLEDEHPSSCSKCQNPYMILEIMLKEKIDYSFFMANNFLSVLDNW